MDAREQRGLKIANKTQLTRKGDLWLVPSENSNQWCCFYRTRGCG